MGFPVIATSSRAVAESLGQRDHQQAPVAEMLAANVRVARAVSLPVTADLEGGYGLEPAVIVDWLIDNGIAGCNLEDTDYSGDSGLVDIDRQADYLRRFRLAAKARGVDLVLNARIDVYLHQQADSADLLNQIMDRATAYLAAGADCVFPIGIRSPEAIEMLVAQLAAPVNVLAYPQAPPPATLAELGVARISLAGGLTQVAAGAIRGYLSDLLTGLGATESP